MNLNDILSVIISKTRHHRPTRSGNGYKTLCPAHDDHNPSLTISKNSEGKILLCCHAGCQYKEILAATGLTATDLFPDKPNDYKYTPMKSKRTEYPYIDEHEIMLYTKVKTEDEYYLNNGKKNFHYERIDEYGNTVYNRKGCRNILYRLPELLKGITEGKTVFLVEGEKDVENLIKRGFIATTTTESTTWHDEFTKILQNADVVILYDNDKTGLKRRDLLINKLVGKVKKLRVVDLPGIEYRESHGQDISDWFDIGNKETWFLEIVETTLEYAFPEQIGALRSISVDELLSLELPKREMLLAPFLPSQGLVLLVAKRGVGKTHVALGIAYAVASGSRFLRWFAPEPKKVVYIDGEMPAVLMQERLKMIATMTRQKPNSHFLKLITPDLQEHAMPDLATEEGRDMIEEYIKDYDLIVIDNISCLFRSGSENESESWQQAQEWALNLRRRGKSILFVHHAGKNGVQRGTSKREDILDSIIILKHPEDYKAEEGARFEVHFDKARHFAGQDANSFQVQLLEKDGQWLWETSNDPEETILKEIAAMKIEGKTILEIMKKTKRTKSQVETLTAKAKARGFLV